MLLIDRPLDESIIINREIEYFGPWSQVFNYPDEIKEPNFVPYPNPDKVYDVALDSVKESADTLDKLSKIMPELTNLDLGPKFWKILFGHLVVTSSGKIHDISNRIKSLPDSNYIIGLPQKILLSSSLPFSFSDSKLLIHREIIPKLTIRMIKEIYNNFENINYVKDRVIFKSGPNFRNIIISIIKKIISNPSPKRIDTNNDKVRSLLWDHFDNFQNIENTSYVKKTDLFSDINITKIYKKKKFDLEKRKFINENIPSHLGWLLSKTIPFTCLEGLKEIINKIDLSKLQKYNNLKRIYNHSSIFQDDDYNRILAGLLSNKGYKIISTPHGGFAYYVHPYVFIESELTDEFISTGFKDWAKRGKNKDDNFTNKYPRPLPSIKLSKLNKNIANKYGKKTTWKSTLLLLTENRKIKWLYTPLLPDMAYDYYTRQGVLLKYFNTVIPSVAKLYPKEFGWNQKKWIEKKFNKLKVAHRSKNFISYALESEIVIIDYNSTGFIEMVATKKIPFMCTWNRRWFRGDDLFEEILNTLKDASIFFESPDELVNKYKEISNGNIQEWWENSKRLDALEIMSNNFAMISDQCEQIWSQELAK